MVAESLEYLVSVIYYCEIYERLYSGIDSGLAATMQLDASLVDLYASVLEYLWCAKEHLQGNTAGKMP